MKTDTSHRFEGKLVVGILLLVLLFILLAITFLVTSRSHYLSQIKDTSHNLAQLLEQRVIDKARLIDDAVVRVERELNRQLTIGGVEVSRLEQLLDSEQKQLPEINAIRVSNAAGDLLWGKGIVPGVFTSIADRQYFKNLREQATNDLIITEPFIGKVSGIWVLGFTRSYHTADGKFAGVVFASVPVNTFDHLLQTGNIGKMGTVVLRYEDMGLITRFPPISGPAGQPGNKKVSDEFVKILESGLQEALFHTAQTPDSVERTYSFRRVSGRPFTLAVGLVDDEYMASWRTLVIWVVALVGVFFLVTSIFTWMVLRHLRERSAMEKVLNEDLTRRRILIEKSRDGIVILDNQGKVWEANQCFVELLGYTSEEIQQRHVWDWDTRWTHEQFFEMIEQGDMPNNYLETPYRRKDGSICYVEISSNAVEYIGRKMVFCVCRNITERKRARDEREQLLAAIEQTSEVIVITDTKGDIQFANPAFERTTGYTLQEVVHHNLRILKSGEHEAAFYEEMWKTISSGQVWTGHMVNRKKDGTLFTEDATISPVFDGAGTIIKYIAVKRDITEKLKLEAQFIQAQKMESVGRLTGGVAHDFNNILSVIFGYTDLAMEQVDRSLPVYTHLKLIRESAQRSADIVRQLLAFSRQQAIAPKILDLNSSVAQMLHILRRLIGEAIDLAWIPAPALPPVKIDPSQIDQILANLCVNARDAINGIGNITIATNVVTLGNKHIPEHPEIAPGDYIVLSVSDDGAGMDKKIIDKIFDPFFTTKAIGQGTGLGLATVYGIVKQNNGVIKVDSELGNGTTFTLYLPCHAGESVESQKKAIESSLTSKGETILLVEDDPVVLKMSLRILEDFGYQVLVAGSPNEALKIVAQHTGKIDLVVTDVIMPEMNGRELSDQLIALRPGLKRLFMSGYTADIISPHGVLDTNLNFLQKPFSRKAFSEKIREVLDS